MAKTKKVMKKKVSSKMPMKGKKCATCGKKC